MRAVSPKSYENPSSCFIKKGDKNRTILNCTPLQDYQDKRKPCKSSAKKTKIQDDSQLKSWTKLQVWIMWLWLCGMKLLNSYEKPLTRYKSIVGRTCPYFVSNVLTMSVWVNTGGIYIDFRTTKESIEQLKSRKSKTAWAEKHKKNANRRTKFMLLKPKNTNLRV